MDGLIAAKCQIDFDPVDVPRRAFMTAGEAWLACRDGKLDPNHFGHGDVTGTWFIKINVIRDRHCSKRPRDIGVGRLAGGIVQIQRSVSTR